MKLRTILATATTAAILATSGVAIAGAASGSDSTAKPAVTTAVAKSDRPHAGARMKVRLRLRKLLKGACRVVTDTIGIDRKTLRTELRSGKTLAEIATDHGSTPQAVIDALVAAANKKLDAAATAGKISPERAARIEARLPARITKLVNEWHPKHLR